ncbi:unnamed protein product [Lactuca virosa]|uniref:Uncharacterized protein n=1 Tax=Lactuca virosa TaxID=75947 RepID=A0AAU9MEG5_9ASTR|nr:unnamed protein product [Lactuca virosa]
MNNESQTIYDPDVNDLESDRKGDGEGIYESEVMEAVGLRSPLLSFKPRENKKCRIRVLREVGSCWAPFFNHPSHSEAGVQGVGKSILAASVVLSCVLLLQVVGESVQLEIN